MLQSLLQDMIRTGSLSVRIGRNQPFQAGQSEAENADFRCTVRLRDRASAIKIALDPEFYLGECYMNDELAIEEGSLWTLLELIGRNMGQRPKPGLAARSRAALARLIEVGNSPRRARRNASFHYDIPDRFYRRFLDLDLQYSCAYFEQPDDSLETAQIRKKAHIAAKLDLRAGQRVLDIGCGWGGFALSLARIPGVHVTGITLSAEQLEVARDRARRLGFDDRVRFELCDYRELGGCFDRIVSVGMFEHVGREHYPAFFAAVRRLLTEDGVALIHSIARKGPGAGSNRWMRKHIFPGGYIPAVSETVSAIEQSGLWITDIELLRLHYADTLRHWRERFLRESDLIETMFGARFRRMWEFYLASCEMAFRFDNLMVHQVQLTRRIDALPRTRGYIEERERELFALFSAELSQSSAPEEPPSRAENENADA